MISQTRSCAVTGVDAFFVDVEIDISSGLPAFTTVGLAETSVKESRERVRSAINNSGYKFPDDRVTVNLAPADIKKDGTAFDLPVAIGILAAVRIVPEDRLNHFVYIGELSLDGRVKPVKGTLTMAIEAAKAGYQNIIVPYDNRREASVVNGIRVFPAKTLSQVVGFINGFTEIQEEAADIDSLFTSQPSPENDFADIAGQTHVKRAMEISAAGSHNVLMSGPPGSGKTMIARSFASILPPLTFEEALETTKIFSVSGMLDKDQALITNRPFRAPHHTISDVGLIGGGHRPKPGEVSLAHNGVLFLDELPEFKKHVLEVLRQPLEDRHVTISRAVTTLTYPAAFTLIAAMNPCPCGYYSDPSHACRCSPAQIQRYRGKISGPLLDRIDIQVEVPAVPFRDIKQHVRGESSAEIRSRVIAARKIQSDRFKNAGIYSNAGMNNRLLKKHCRLDSRAMDLLETAIEKLGMSARAYNRVIKIARTIADLEAVPEILAPHIAEAIQYRNLDRKDILPSV